VEIAYQVEQDHQGKGYATEAAAALTRFALETGQVKTVIAHTLPQTGASSKVLTKCGFQHVGEVIHPEDGKVWKWEKHAP
jgi:RimJ/RimL family protein N-acetyltransferase